MKPFSNHHLDINLVVKNIKYAQSNGDLGHVIEPRKKAVDPMSIVIGEALTASCTVYVNTSTDQWTGSAFHVGNGYFVTAGHVVPEELKHKDHRINIAFDGKTMYPAQAVVTEPNYDVGILYCNKISDEVSSVKLGDSDKVKHGDEIAVIGSPEGWNDSVSEGIVSNMHQSLGKYAPSPAWNDIIFVTANILEGASGAMVIGTDALVYGSVMGVTGQNASTLGQGMNAVCPSNKIRKLLYSIGIKV